MRVTDFLRALPSVSRQEATLVARSLDGEIIEFSGFSVVHDEDGIIACVILQERE